MYLFNSTAVKGVSKKLVKPWQGPGVVLQRITPALYLVKTKEDTRVVHHDKMRLCKDRITPSWARQFQANVKHWESAEDFEKKPRYCFCRKGDNGEFMVQCDKCYEWFHGLCIGQDKRAEARKREYVCGLCK